MKLWISLSLLLAGAACGPVGDLSCYALQDECSCWARRADCSMVTESCWCPDACGAKVACFCGGGKFLRCEPRSTALQSSPPPVR